MHEKQQHRTSDGEFEKIKKKTSDGGRCGPLNYTVQAWREEMDCFKPTSGPKLHETLNRNTPA